MVLDFVMSITPHIRHNNMYLFFHHNFQIMRNRKIRVDVAEEDGNNRKTSNRDRDEDREDRSGGVSDWRAAPRDSGPPRQDRSPERYKININHSAKKFDLN